MKFSSIKEKKKHKDDKDTQTQTTNKSLPGPLYGSADTQPSNREQALAPEAWHHGCN